MSSYAPACRVPTQLTLCGPSPHSASTRLVHVGGIACRQAHEPIDERMQQIGCCTDADEYHWLERCRNCCFLARRWTKSASAVTDTSRSDRDCPTVASTAQRVISDGLEFSIYAIEHPTELGNRRGGGRRVAACRRRHSRCAERTRPVFRTEWVLVRRRHDQKIQRRQ